MNYIPQILIDLAKAFYEGDDSALAPLHDCLCEMDWEPLATYIRMLYLVDGLVSKYVEALAKEEAFFFPEDIKPMLTEDCKPSGWLGRRYAEIQKMGNKAAKNT